MFSDKWTRYKKLALLNYADTTNYTHFGFRNNRTGVLDFIKKHSQRVIVYPILLLRCRVYLVL
jgi:hypothetical protein